MKWQDASSCSRGDKERIPTIWHLSECRICISVHRHIHYPKDMWLLTCEPFFDKYELPNKDIEDAKKLALDLVAVKLRNAASFFTNKPVDLTPRK